VEELIKAFLPSGPLGVVCAVLLWRDWKRDERDADREKRREDIEKNRIEADKSMAIAMTLLAERLKP
jgi:hypothetical protein